MRVLLTTLAVAARDAGLARAYAALEPGGRAALLIGDGDGLDNLDATSRAAEEVGFSCLASASIRATVERTARVKGQRRTECALAPPTSRMIFCCDDHLIVAVSAGTRSSSRRKGDSSSRARTQKPPPARLVHGSCVLTRTADVEATLKARKILLTLAVTVINRARGKKE